MQGYLDDIERATLDNDDYRRVLYTGHHLQLVLMTLQPGEEIGEEVHEGHDQFFRIEQGEGSIVIGGQSRPAPAESGIIVPAGARHNLINTGSEPLKLYTLYGPPEHRRDVVHPTKADESEEHFDGKTSE